MFCAKRRILINAKKEMAFSPFPIVLYYRVDTLGFDAFKLCPIIDLRGFVFD
jgi:hypothetical protein